MFLSAQFPLIALLNVGHSRFVIVAFHIALATNPYTLHFAAPGHSLPERTGYTIPLGPGQFGV